ncbi:hypothetical protein FRB98_003118 [Tulasnella sp. 332]|nr:hypothetical protein FRB98_003118 [Tulasnella sp. 332]
MSHHREAARNFAEGSAPGPATRSFLEQLENSASPLAQATHAHLASVVEPEVVPTNKVWPTPAEAEDDLMSDIPASPTPAPRRKRTEKAADTRHLTEEVIEVPPKDQPNRNKVQTSIMESGNILTPKRPRSLHPAKRVHLDVGPSPFIPGRGVKFGKVGAGVAKATKTEEDVAKEKAALAAAEEAEKKFDAKYNFETKKVSTGTLQFIKPMKQNHADRYMPHPRIFEMVQEKPTQKAAFIAAEINQAAWVWISVHNHPQPTQDDANHFMAALQHIEDTRAVPDFSKGDYAIHLMTRANGKVTPHIPLFCVDHNARRQLLATPAFAFASKGVDLVFWIHNQTAWGNRVVLDFVNAPPHEVEFLLGLEVALKDIIEWKDKEKKIPKSLRIAKLNWAPPKLRDPRVKPQEVPGEARTLKWRVSFVLDMAKLEGWVEPSLAGLYAARGDISIETLPFCTSCMTTSHPRENCTWWVVPGVLPQMKMPNRFRALTWSDVDTFEVIEKHKVLKGKDTKGKGKA